MRIALIGYGRMGKMVEEIALQRGHQIVLTIKTDNISDFDLENISKAEVVIEFTGPDSAYDNVIKCLEFGIPVICGSTGWNDKLEDAKKYCLQKNGSLLHTSNFSIGMNVFFEINQLLAKLMADQAGYEVTLKEIHHKGKKDAPSGTAVTLAEQIIENQSKKKNWVNHTATSPESIPILSERKDAAPGIHYVCYNSEIDEIKIMHAAHNRRGLAFGAVVAAEYIADKKGVITMTDVLFS